MNEKENNTLNCLFEVNCPTNKFFAEFVTEVDIISLDMKKGGIADMIIHICIPENSKSDTENKNIPFATAIKKFDYSVISNVEDIKNLVFTVHDRQGNPIWQIDISVNSFTKLKTYNYNIDISTNAYRVIGDVSNAVINS